MKRIVIVSCAILLCSIFFPRVHGLLAEERKDQSPVKSSKPQQEKPRETPAEQLKQPGADGESLESRQRRELQEQVLDLRERRNMLTDSEKKLRLDQRKLRQDIRNQRIDQQVTQVEQQVQKLNERILELEQKKLQLTNKILQLQQQKNR
ncbi:MAG: hypothetical protein V1792_22665 [Pseudomonadota bacterium]